METYSQQDGQGHQSHQQPNQEPHQQTHSQPHQQHAVQDSHSLGSYQGGFGSTTLNSQHQGHSAFHFEGINDLTVPVNHDPWQPLPPPPASLEHTASYPGALRPLDEPYHQSQHFQGSLTSDSGYTSIPVTSGGVALQSHGLELNVDYASYPPDAHNNAASARGARTVISEPIYDPRVQASQKSGRSRARTQVPPCKACGKVLKNPSDAHKHRLQHQKPHYCSEPGCPRPEGFATQNDLQRHRASVHKLIPLVGRQDGYVCALCPLPQGGVQKFWPRKDNFKAHVLRKHSDYNVTEVIEHSTTKRPDDAMTALTFESGYASNPAQIEPLEHAFRQDMRSPITPSLTGSTLQQSDYLMGLGSHHQNDSLAGVGGAASASALGPPTTDGLFTSGDDGLTVLSTAAAQYGQSISPADSVMRTPDHRFRPTSHFPSEQQDQTMQPPINFDGLSWSPSHAPTMQQGFAGSTVGKVPSPGDGEGTFKCEDCGKLKKRECDLRKHRKRHTRPYGCTFTDCPKRFGSRNDWKRHEGSQHTLPEMWKCTLSRMNAPICGNSQPDHESFKKHLSEKHHDIDRFRHDILCNDMHLSVNGYNGFWCGFCVGIVRPVGMWAQNAMEFRFKHVGDHYDKDDRVVDDWVCARLHKRRRDLTEHDMKKLREWSRIGRWSDDGWTARSAPAVTVNSIPSSWPQFPNGQGESSCKASRQLRAGKKRRRLSLDVDQDASNVSDDEWQARGAFAQY